MSDDLKTTKLNTASAHNRERRRKIVMPQKTNQIDEVTVVPTLDALMNDAMSIIGAELTRYKQKSNRGVTLDLKESRAVQGYMETLVKLSRESREQARADDLSQLTDEELLQLASQVVKGQLPSPKKLEENNDE